MADGFPGPVINREILSELFTEQCDTVGYENLNDLCNGFTDFEDDDSAFRFDVGDAIALLANAVTIVAFVWTALDRRRERRAPTIEQIDRMVLEEVVKSSGIEREQRLRLYRAIIKRHVDRR